MVPFAVAAAALLLAAFTSAEVQRLKLNKVSSTQRNPELESLHIAEKYGSVYPQRQAPLAGADASGRLLRQTPGGDDLFWTQEQVKSGHSAPLSSMSSPVSLMGYDLQCAFVRLPKRAVFCTHHFGNASPGGKALFYHGIHSMYVLMRFFSSSRRSSLIPGMY